MQTLTKSVLLAALLFMCLRTDADCAQPAAAPPPDPTIAYQTKAVFTYGGDIMPQTSVIATIDHSNISGHYWLRLNFYSYMPVAADLPYITAGRVVSMDRRRKKLSLDQANKSNATIQLTLDKEFSVTQIDASVPGYVCTLAGKRIAPQTIVQAYAVTGNRVTLKMHGTFPCDVPPGGPKLADFGIDVDIDAQIYKVQ